MRRVLRGRYRCLREDNEVCGPRQEQRGVVSLELALVLPFLLILVGGMIETSRLVELKQVLATASREGARQAAAGVMSDEQVKVVTKRYVERAGFNVTNVSVSVSNLTHPGTDARYASQHDQLKVSISIPFADVRLVNAGFITEKSLVVQAQSVWMSLKDKPYPSPPEPMIE